MTNPTPSASRRTGPWLLAVLAALLVGGIGGWTAATATRPDAAVTDFTPSPPSAETAASTSIAPAPGATTGAATKALKLGQSQQFTADGWTVAVTALAHKRQAGYEGVQVRTCNKGATSFPVSTRPWNLSYDRGEQLVDVTVSGGGLLSPEFVERDLAGGKCAKGWISFEPPKSGKPDGVEYRIEGVASVRWEW